MIELTLLVVLLLLFAACFNWARSYGDPFRAGDHRVDTGTVIVLAAVGSIMTLVLLFR